MQFLPMVTERLPLDLWFVQFCRRRGAKIVLTVHDLLPHDTGETHKQIFHDLYHMVDGIICHSENIRERLVVEFSVQKEKIAVIPHGPFFYDLPVPAEQTLQSFGLDPRKLLALWQGIISPYKGIDLLLEAWQKVEVNRGGCFLLIVGTGPQNYWNKFANKSQSQTEPRQFHLCFISTEELVALYRAADIVVYPYRAITTSGALATGLALGKTIVASDLPVFRELLTDRQNGLLVDPQNSEALAGALLELFSRFFAASTTGGRCASDGFR